ncbi:zinc permease [Aeromicrobium sp. Root236]|uniref:ZIP family metal transporter n=1 Tax=Aeromicrobium sp. Root236 TaxID=1736498 RepID=UPI0006FF7E6F|nr:ZIP family metal transporter [Aeromicrobium sp. Root236]KRC63281.1 zinc permease [Aeromicrobium sp. Root236]
MTLSTTLLLGLIAGGAIIIGLPIGRLKRPAPQLRITLSATAVGVLLFLFWDVMSAAWEPIDSALAAVHEGDGSAGPIVGYGALFVAGLSLGLLGLVAFDRHASRSSLGDQRSQAPSTFQEGDTKTATGVRWSTAKQLSLMIAVGIGLHNFAEGLAIGQAAASDEIALATVLVIGFALHNATEGFGIVAPLAGDLGDDGQAQMPSWRFLLTMAAIGGGPTFVGAGVGHSFTSEPVSVAFLTLAAGSIVYVIAQLLGVVAKAKRSDLVALGLLLGILAGFITDGIVIAGGV